MAILAQEPLLAHPPASASPPPAPPLAPPDLFPRSPSAPSGPAAADPTPLPPLPPTLAPLRPLLLGWLRPLLAWLSAWRYGRALHDDPAHPLVRLAHSGFDLAPVIAACASYYHSAGPGTTPTYSVNTLLRAEMVRVWRGSCGDEVLARQLRNDLICRWFCGLPLFGPSPDHCTLWRFHAWLTIHQPRALFAGVLDFLDGVDPEDPARTPQVVDTFALASPAAPTSPSEILRRLSLRIVTCWSDLLLPGDPDPLADLDLSKLPSRPPLYTADLRTAALRQAVPTARALRARLLPQLAALAPADARALRELLDVLAKVIADETTTDAGGQVVELPVGQKGAYRLGSPVDRAATFRKHGEKPAVFGYNAAIATTGTRIRAALVVTGSTPDSQAPVALLGQQKEAGLALPRKMIMDQAGGEGKTRADVATVSGGQTQMVAKIPPGGGADPARFGPADFAVSADGQECTCPNGVLSTQPYRSGEADGVHFRFTAKQCAGCPLLLRCRGKASKPKGHRTVYISPYAGQLLAGAAFNATAAGKELLGIRWLVEPTIAWLVRFDGGRRARRSGAAAAQLHLYQVCAVRNLWRWLARAAARAGRRRGQKAAA